MPSIAALMRDCAAVARAAVVSGRPDLTPTYSNIIQLALPAVHAEAQIEGGVTIEGGAAIEGLTASLDLAGNFGSNVFTAPTRGVYQIDLAANIQALPEGLVPGHIMVIDGQGVCRTRASVDASLIAPTMVSSSSCLTRLVVGDTLRMAGSNIILLPDPPAVMCVHMLTQEPEPEPEPEPVEP